jgi:hypothetical protein
LKDYPKEKLVNIVRNKALVLYLKKEFEDLFNNIRRLDHPAGLKSGGSLKASKAKKPMIGKSSIEANLIKVCMGNST